MNWTIIVPAIAAAMSVLGALCAGFRSGWQWLKADAKHDRIAEGLRSMDAANAQAKRLAELGLLDEAREREIDALVCGTRPLASFYFYREHRWVFVVQTAYWFTLAAYGPATIAVATTKSSWSLVLFALVIVLSLIAFVIFYRTSAWSTRRISATARDMGAFAAVTLHGSVERSLPEGPSARSKPSSLQ